MYLNSVKIFYWKYLDVFCRHRCGKDKHDCFIINFEGIALYYVFTIANTLGGLNELLYKIQSVSSDLSKIKVELEITEH